MVHFYGLDQAQTEEELEQEKQQLLTMKWNNHFTMDYFDEDKKIDENFQSEKQAYEKQVKKEMKLGNDLWALIGYIAFFAIFSYLVFSHVRVSMFNMYNDALKSNIEGVTIKSGDNKYINITEVRTYEEITNWLEVALPSVIDTERAGENGKLYFFINDYNYVLKRDIRACFRLAQESTDQYSNGGPKPNIWRRSEESSKTLDKKTFTGATSGKDYVYIENGFRNSGSYCTIIPIEDITTNMQNFVNDEIISNRMFFLSLEFVTYEASNYFYTYNAILFNLLNNGDVETEFDIASLDIRKYNEWYDWIRMIFELIFIFVLIGMIYQFIRRKYRVYQMYNKWEHMEIRLLKKFELEQRRKYEPEFIRKIKALVDFFTIFEVLFYIFSFVIMIMWLVFIIEYQKLKKDYSDEEQNDMYNNFYSGKELFDSYKIMLSLASICISFNLLSHIFMLNHFLADSKMEIIYFLIFYIILILGFVSVAHLTFGPYIKEYHTFGDAMVE